MPTLIIRENSLIENEDKVFEKVGNVCQSLLVYFNNQWPETARLYRDVIDDDHEIRIDNSEDVKHLGTVTGTIYCVVYPALVIAAIGLIGLTAALIFSQDTRSDEQAPTDDARNIESPNNSINDRSNQFRLNERIPDIYGKVFSVPDLIMKPYAIYEGIPGDIVNKVEYGYYAVGRGAYEITNLKDDQTLLEDIEGASAEIYAPYFSPNNGAAQEIIGDVITEPLRTVVRTEQVSGQVITPYDGTDQYDIGPFIIDKADFFYLNFSASEMRDRVGFDILVQEVNPAGVPVGSIDTTSDYIENWPWGFNPVLTVKVPNIFADVSFNTRVQVTVRRTTPYTITVDINEAGEPVYNEEVDDLSWEDLYSVSNVTPNHFGDVTTIYTRTIANESSQRLENRRLNCEAFRKIKLFTETVGEWVEGSVLITSSNFVDIALAICRDGRIGRRALIEIDIDSFKNAAVQAQGYFGNYRAVEFNHTFDDASLSFEETLAVVCAAGFCTAYRQGQVIKLFFEKETSTSTLLFNHRNKLPNSETRTVTFGTINDYDGVEIEYRDEADGTPAYYYIPADRTAVNPQISKKIGVKYRLQAYFHAWREWNTIRYQNSICEFDATHEAVLLIRKERILVADNTRPNTFDGEIVAQLGKNLTLSQPFTFESGKHYTIWLQIVDGTTQSIGISPGVDEYNIVLDGFTNKPLAVDPQFYSRSVYEIVENSSFGQRAYLVDEKSPKESFLTTLKCVNYDDRYYQNDKDYVNGIINSEGQPF